MTCHLSGGRFYIGHGLQNCGQPPDGRVVGLNNRDQAIAELLRRLLGFQRTIVARKQKQVDPGARYVQALRFVIAEQLNYRCVAGEDINVREDDLIAVVSGGYLAGQMLDPLKQEQINHIAIAVGCLALSVLAILASVLLPLTHYS